MHGLLSLAAVAAALGTRAATGSPSAATPPSQKITPVEQRASHVIRTAHGPNGGRVFLKGPAKNPAVHQSLAEEARILAEIGPRIVADNPATRCPAFFGYSPSQNIVAMEAIDGQSLVSLLFGLARPAPDRVRHLLVLCAEWLASFHAATRLDREDNPFTRLAVEFARPRIRKTLRWAARPGTVDEVRWLLHAVGRRYQTCRIPLCSVHGEFGPQHVLVERDRIYVIDFGAAHEGLPCEDVMWFATVFDTLAPWRRLLGGLGMDLTEQRRVFLDAYTKRSPVTGAAERAAMRFARILAMTWMVAQYDTRRTWRGRLHAALALPFVRSRYQQVCDEELRALRADIASSAPLRAAQSEVPAIPGFHAAALRPGP